MSRRRTAISKWIVTASLAAILALESTTAEESKAPVLLELRGRWILGNDGKPVAAESFRRGLQPSGLVYRRGSLSSVGDQRSQYPGRLLEIDLASGQLRRVPVALWMPKSSVAETPRFEAFRALRNPDLEGIAVDPADARTVFAVTEDKTPWVLEIRVGTRDSPSVLSGVEIPELRQLTEIRFPDGLKPWRGSPNFRVEGIAIDGASKTVYFAYERASDDLPRVLKATLDDCRRGKPVSLKDCAIDFASVPRRADKGRALLNINDIQFIEIDGRDSLIAVARDQERVLLIDLESKAVTRIVDLDLRDPLGRRMHWVSPEGIAFDAESDRVWIINDPDSVRGNYKLRGAKEATEQFAAYTPLLFETKLSRILPKPADAPRKAEGGS